MPVSVCTVDKEANFSQNHLMIICFKVVEGL